MKYQSSQTNKIYNHTFTRKQDICPECSHLRKKKKDKCLQYYADTNTAYCFNCNTTFFEYKPFEQKTYFVPEWKNKTKLSDKSVKFFESRMISQSTLNEMKIYTDVEYMPQFEKEIEVICFPYFFEGKLINIKFRGAKKSFKLVSNAEKIFWNLDVIKDFDEIIIVEGEIDALTFIENGFKNVLSVPNGANNNLDYLDNYIGLFEELDKIYLATDQDTKGIELRDEFIRRFGAENCSIVSFKECKDGNEYFQKYGGIEFKDLLKNSKDVPIKGIITAKDIYNELIEFYNEGVKKGLTIDSEIDEFISWELSRLAIVTGRPGCGKSELVDFIVSKLNLIHGWKAAYFTPENYPLKYHYAKLYEKFIGTNFKKGANNIDFDLAYEYIQNNFYWILNENDLSIDNILESTKFLIKKHGIKVLVVDPYNKVEHQYNSNTSETQYVSKFLDKLIMFGKLNNILIILVAHPRKLQKGEIPTLYDISGSANFYNKTDYGVTVHRQFDENNLMTNFVEIHFQKIKFKNLGHQGVCELKYNYNNGRFENINSDVNHWDNSNWLVKDTNIKSTDFWNELTEKDNEVPF